MDLMSSLVNSYDSHSPFRSKVANTQRLSDSDGLFPAISHRVEPCSSASPLSIKRQKAIISLQ